MTFGRPLQVGAILRFQRDDRLDEHAVTATVVAVCSTDPAELADPVFPLDPLFVATLAPR